MKAIKLSMIGLAAIVSTSAMANVVTDTASGVVKGASTLVKTATNPAAISAEVGTLGAGVNLSWSANETTEVVVGWAGGDVAKVINDNFDAKGVNYQLDTRFSNPYVGVQVRPAAGWFTVGTGIIIPDNKIKVKANPAGSSENAIYRIGGEDVSVKALGTLEGDINHRNRVAPYLTVGFRPNLHNNWGVFGEIGAAYLGKTRATVTAVNGDGTLAPEKQAEYAKQAERDLEEKSSLEWAPIVKLGATYRF